MLYLIQDRDYLKIGYSANIDQRKKAYETTNCYAEIIMTKDGSRKDETALHKLCEKWHYKNEWFYYDEEIVKIFEEYQPDQEERISNLEKEIENLTKMVSNIERVMQIAVSEIKEQRMQLQNINSERTVLGLILKEETDKLLKA